MTAKYEQIKQFILERIEQGEWQENDSIPSENKLAEQFTVSRMTARRALDELNQEGVLRRVQGSGTVVASLKSQGSMFEIKDIADEIKARGHAHSMKVIKLKTVPANNEAAAQLMVEQDTPLYYSLIVHYENKQPVQLEERFINAALIPAYINQGFKEFTPHEYLTTVAPLTAAEHTIEAISADTDLQQLLQLNNPEPCLKLSRTTSSKQGVVGFAKIIYPGSRYRLSGRLDFSGR